MAVDLSALIADLMAEGDALAAVLQQAVSDRGEAVWHLPSSAVPWTVQNQLVHLAWNDEAAQLAMADPERFRAQRPDTPEGIQAMVDGAIRAHAHREGSAVLEWFQTARRSLADTARVRLSGDRVPWYGPDMSVASKLTARLMETWAHGYDIAEAIGTPTEPTDRVAHVAFLGLRAVPNAFAARNRPTPTEPVSALLRLPSGGSLVVGDPAAADRVTGDAYELALVVTQRRHRNDTTLVAVGPVADEWLSIAQAFAGPPGTGRAATAR